MATRRITHITPIAPATYHKMILHAQRSVKNRIVSESGRIGCADARPASLAFTMWWDGMRAREARRMSVTGGMLPSMVPWTLVDIDKALHASWAADTCSPDDLARAGWHPGNPAWGHCDITALVCNDIFGGDLMLGEVRATNGEQHGYHWWNRLASGIEIDLTYEQFQSGQVVTATRVAKRPPGPLPRRRKEYELLRDRVAAHLGPLPIRS